MLRMILGKDKYDTEVAILPTQVIAFRPNQNSVSNDTTAVITANGEYLVGMNVQSFSKMLVDELRKWRAEV